MMLSFQNSPKKTGSELGEDRPSRIFRILTEERSAAAELGEEAELDAPAESEEVAELDDAELPEFTEEDAAAELGEEAELDAPAESEEVAELDDAELPEFTEEDAAAELGEEAEPNSRLQRYRHESPIELEGGRAETELVTDDTSFQNLPKKTRQLS